MATYAQQANSGKDSGSNSGHNNNSGGSNSGYNNNNHSSSYSSNHSNHNNSNSSHNNSSNSNNHNSSDGSKKEEFRKYLEKSGVLDTLTKVLVGLYEEPERPSNAIEYIKRYMGAPKNVDVEGLKRENEQLRRQLAALSVADNITNNTEPTNNNPTASSNPASST